MGGDAVAVAGTSLSAPAISVPLTPRRLGARIIDSLSQKLRASGVSVNLISTHLPDGTSSKDIAASVSLIPSQQNRVASSLS